MQSSVNRITYVCGANDDEDDDGVDDDGGDNHDDEECLICFARGVLTAKLFCLSERKHICTCGCYTREVVLSSPSTMTTTMGMMMQMTFSTHIRLKSRWKYNYQCYELATRSLILRTENKWRVKQLNDTIGYTLCLCMWLVWWMRWII